MRGKGCLGEFWSAEFLGQFSIASHDQGFESSTRSTNRKVPRLLYGLTPAGHCPSEFGSRDRSRFQPFCRLSWETEKVREL